VKAGVGVPIGVGVLVVVDVLRGVNVNVGVGEEIISEKGLQPASKRNNERNIHKPARNTFFHIILSSSHDSHKKYWVAIEGKNG
jgi:hypothetical protein